MGIVFANPESSGCKVLLVTLWVGIEEYKCEHTQLIAIQKILRDGVFGYEQAGVCQRVHYMGVRAPQPFCLAE